jgi:hypothetical protein
MLEGGRESREGEKITNDVSWEIFDENFGCRNLHKIVSVPFASPMLFRVNCSYEYLRGFASVDNNLDRNFVGSVERAVR